MDVPIMYNIAVSAVHRTSVYIMPVWGTRRRQALVVTVLFVHTHTSPPRQRRNINYCDGNDKNNNNNNLTRLAGERMFKNITI